MAVTYYYIGELKSSEELRGMTHRDLLDYALKMRLAIHGLSSDLAFEHGVREMEARSADALDH